MCQVKVYRRNGQSLSYEHTYDYEVTPMEEVVGLMMKMGATIRARTPYVVLMSNTYGDRFIFTC